MAQTKSTRSLVLKPKNSPILVRSRKPYFFLRQHTKRKKLALRAQTATHQLHGIVHRQGSWKHTAESSVYCAIYTAQPGSIKIFDDLCEMTSVLIWIVLDVLNLFSELFWRTWAQHTSTNNNEISRKHTKAGTVHDVFEVMRSLIV